MSQLLPTGIGAMQAELIIARESGDTLRVNFKGDWKVDRVLPSADKLLESLRAKPSVKQLTFDAGHLESWDSGLLTFILKITAIASASGIAIEKSHLPDGVQRLLALASAVPERKGARRQAAKIPFLDRVANLAIAFWRSSQDMLAFLGETCIAVVHFLTGRAKFRLSDLFLTIQECGVQALPIVSLISFLVGLILAFIGAIQLRLFGAQIYVASLVGIGMVRALAAVMTGIIMAGRTGASFAAQLGTMQVNEEIDALKTLGISPMEFLVLPRMIALSLMMPLLALFANLMGILGGFFIGVVMLDLNPMAYYLETQVSVTMNDFWVGLFSAAVFGVLVALAGCMRGMQCGRSASAVGEATTSAVVTSIVSIVIATAIITLVCSVLHI
jgi:phospholipid/cholesterol/gamma-HCH transport system permease protein